VRATGSADIIYISTSDSNSLKTNRQGKGSPVPPLKSEPRYEDMLLN